MPDHLQAYRQTWADLHPDWEHRLWGEADLTWLQNRELFDNAEDFTEHVGQFRSDVARYEILRLLGGVYVDCDMEARRPIDELLGCDVFVCRETPKFLGNTVIGSVREHPFLVDLVDLLPARVAATKGNGWRPNRITGPHYLTTVAERHDVTVYPTGHFFPYGWNELERAGEDFSDAYAVHHWDNQRKLRNQPREVV